MPPNICISTTILSMASIIRNLLPEAGLPLILFVFATNFLVEVYFYMVRKVLFLR